MLNTATPIATSARIVVRSSRPESTPRLSSQPPRTTTITPSADVGERTGPLGLPTMHARSHAQIEPFVTLDGSEIREWAGPVSMPAKNQSLAEAMIPVGGATTEHYHRLSEELYLVRSEEHTSELQSLR